jgi:hypothetical protein
MKWSKYIKWKVKAFFINLRTRLKYGKNHPNKICMPKFEVVKNPEIKLSEITARRFDIVDRNQIRAEDAIMRPEDEKVFNSFGTWVPSRRDFHMEEPVEVGEFPVRRDLTVLPADNPDKLRMGWLIYEEVGIMIVNDYAKARISTKD